jgi:HK97 family phage portal protein
MGLIEALGKKLFKGYIADLRRSIGSEVISEILKMVRGRAVYPPDSVDTYINRGYLFNPVVYSIVSFIAQKAGAIPWGVYEVKNDKALHSYKSANSYNINTKIIKTKALVAIPDHELNAIFLKPNILQGWAEFFEQVVGFKLVTGNSYIHMIGPTAGLNKGSIREMWNIPSQIIRPVAGDRMEPVRGYKYLAQNEPIPANEIIHLKYWTPEYFNGQNLIGLSPLRASLRLITKSNSSFDSSVGALQNQGAFGIISAEKDTDLTEEQADMIESRLREKVGGPANRGKNIVTSATLKWQQMGMSPVDLNIIESDRMDLRALCNVYHVPSELFNDAANKTYSNTKEAGSAVYTNAVLPALNQFRDAFNQYISNKYPGLYCDYDASMISELQDDLQVMATALSSVWYLSPNEKRDLLNFSADETNPLMNEYWVPSGLMPMSQSMVTDEQLEEEEKKLGL